MIDVDPIHLPDVSDDEDRTLNMLLAQLRAKSSRNLLRASYYDGKRAVRQVGTVIPPQYFQMALVLGWSAKAVDVLARRCNLDSFIWPDGDLGSVGLSEVVTGNRLGTEISSGTISSLMHGTAFLVNTLGDPSAGEVRGLIHVKDALSATGEWNARTRALNSLLSITGRDDENRVTALTLYLDGLTINAERPTAPGARWKVDRQPHPWGVPAEPLVYKPRVGRPFGQSRISRVVMSLHDAALRTVIRMEGHADVYSYPEMWMLGADEKIFKNPDGSQKAVWQTMLGRIKGIPDDVDADPANARADVKQFAASSPQPHIDQLKHQANLFAGETDLPVTALGVQAETNTSTADGSDNAERHLIAEAEGATEEWAPSIQRSLTRALAMQNDLDAVPAEWATIAPKWRPPAYVSQSAMADAGLKRLQAIPWLADTEVGLELLGLSEQQITRALAERRRNSGSAALRAITLAAQTGAAQAVTAPAGQ